MRPGTITALLTMLWVRHGPDEAYAVQAGFLDFDNLPDTNFSCENKVIGGYYADVETGCQMFHVCTIGEITDIKFLCLNGTVFDQETRVCERVDEVDCNKTLSFYDLNLELYGNSPPHSISEEESTEASYHDDLSRESTHSPLTTTPSTSTTTTTTTTSTTSRPFFFTTPTREQFLPTVTSPQEDHDHPYGLHGLHTYQPTRVNVNKPGQSGFLSGSPASPQTGDDHHLHYLNNRFTSTTHTPTHVFNIQNNGPSGFSITSTSRPNSFNSNPFAERDSPQEYHRPFPSVSPGFINHQLSRPSAPSYTTTRRSPFSSSHNPSRQSPIVHAAQNLRTQISSGEDDFSGSQGVQLHSHIPLSYDFGSQQQGHQIHTTPSVAVVATTISTSRSTNSKGFFFKPQAGATNYSNHFRLSPVVSVNLTVSSPQFPETSILPSSYDEYQEHDVHADPFFKDVPRVGGARSNPAQQGFERHKRGTDPVRKSDKTHIKSKKQGHDHERVSPRHEHLMQKKKKKSPVWVHEDFESIARRISEVTRSRVYNYPAAYGDENERPSAAARRRRTTVGSGRPAKKGRVSHAPPKCSNGVGKDRCASPGERDIPRRRSTRQVYSGYYSGDTVPTTTFTCKDKIPGGYYADPETDCQLFHICSQGRHGRLTDNKFWCGPGTRFNQLSRTCQTSELVDCGQASSLYHLNDHFLAEQLDPVARDVLMFESHKQVRK